MGAASGRGTGVFEEVRTGADCQRSLRGAFIFEGGEFFRVYLCCVTLQFAVYMYEIVYVRREVTLCYQCCAVCLFI